jgi:pyrroloquinoline quinone (PQQ) biosynthesis protein C
VTVYFPIEAYRPGTVAPANIPEEPREPAQIIELYEKRRPMTDHPFLQRLRREPVDLRRLWLVMHNFQASISRNFARYLAQVTARIEDVRVRCILAEQLTEELGNGRWEDAHANLFCKLMDAIKAYAPARMDDTLIAPGAGFDRRLSAIYSDPDAYVGLGSMISGEIFGKQIDQFLAAEFRRQKEVDTESLEWLTLHERLEIEHAENSAELSTFIPEEEHAAVVRGAMGMARAGYHFLDDLYTACYGAAEPALHAAAE